MLVTKPNCINYLLTFLSLCFISILTGCGGSGTTSPDGGNGLISFTTLDSYPSGSGVIVASGKAQTTSPDSNYTAAHQDIASVREVLSGSTNLTRTSSSQDSVRYLRSEIGTSSGGKSITVDYGGYFLTNGTEQVSLGEVSIDGVYGVLTAGNKVNGLPTGTFGYQGDTIIYMKGTTQGQTVIDFEGGTFSMTANFSNQTGSIAANTNSYLFNENNIAINSSDGSFSGSSGNIGVIGGATDTSNLKGFFAGTDAAGVHGTAYSTSEDTFVATFVGKKQ